MPKLTDNTVVLDEAGAPTPLVKGDDLPEYAYGQVGEHLLDGPVPGGESDDAEPAGPVDYDKLKAAQVKQLLDARNAGRDEDTRIVPSSAKAADIVKALRADDDRVAALLEGADDLTAKRGPDVSDSAQGNQGDGQSGGSGS